MYLPWTKLPFSFSSEPLCAEVASIDPAAWVPHFNTADFEGEWSSVSLRSRSGREDDSTALGTPEDFQDTPLLATLPALRSVVETFQMPLKSVRLLRLHAGSRVKEHVDSDLGLPVGELRIHVPVVTNPDVEFIVDNRRLFLQAGESWFIDFSLPHRIANRGQTHRTHLIIDGVLNRWAADVLEISARDIVTETLKPDGTARLEEFCELVYRDRVLLATLMQEKRMDDLARATVEAAAERGCHFAVDDVIALQRAHRREWNTRSVSL